MVAKITVPSSIRKALNYNEQKLREGKAECIYAHRFLKEAPALNFYEKLGRFQSLISLNQRATTNCIHVSLNFAPGETIDREKLTAIATRYMEKIGFRGQPYLVYRHLDAGHPHIHIVSTNIQKDGKRISLHNIGRNQSTVARKELETIFGLKRAKNEVVPEIAAIMPVNAQKLAYGRSEIRRGIANVLGSVLPRYKYASLPELNAVLRLYNLVADRGREGGIIYQKGGLVYRVLDENGNKIGVPIKASAIPGKPTLAYLEERFRKNEVEKQAFRKNLKTSIDWIMVRPPKGIQAFKSALEKEKISLVVRQNEEGIIYGLTYIDHNTKCVFNGSEIGKDYSAKAILEKCGIKQMLPATLNPFQRISTTNSSEQSIDQDRTQEKILTRLIDDIISPSEDQHYLPYELKKRKKKKRKSNH